MESRHADSLSRWLACTLTGVEADAHLSAQLFSEAIDKANLEGLPETLESGTGLLTQEEEEALRKKIKRGQMKMAKDRAVLQMAEAKLKAFTEALQQIRTSTGYDDLQDIIDLFNKYEDEKFNKVGAANRMVSSSSYDLTGVNPSHVRCTSARLLVRGSSSNPVCFLASLPTVAGGRDRASREGCR